MVLKCETFKVLLSCRREPTSVCQLKQFTIFLGNYTHEFFLAMPAKVSLKFCFVLRVQRKRENMVS